MQPETARLIAMPYLGIERGRIDRTIAPAVPVAEHIRQLGWQPETLHARVCIDGELIAQARWEYAMPQAGQALTIRVIPLGGDGGKSALRIVALLAIVALSIFTAGGGLAALPGMAAFTSGSFAAGALAAGISIVGSLAISALIPPARPRLADLSALNNTSPTLSLTGSSNQFAPYGVIPRVYGRHRLYPPMAARPFTEVVGNNQYLRLLFCCGYGPLTLSDLKIGETPIEQFRDVQMEIRYGYENDDPLTMIPSDVYEDNLSILLKSASSWQQRTSQANATELSVDVTFPGGLGDFRNNSVTPYLVQIEVEYRVVGDVSWTSTTKAATFAKRQTAFSGANNDLLFTARVAGPGSNNIIVEFVLGSALLVTASSEQVGTLLHGSNLYNFNHIWIAIIQGVTTSAQVKAAIEANALANGFVVVTHAAGNTGAGTITLPIQSILRGGGYVNPPQIFQLAGGFSAVTLFQLTDQRSQQLRFSRKWDVPAEGQYEVRVRKVTTDATDVLIRDQVYWTTLRTIQPGDAVSKPGLCLVAMRIKATDQLNGTVDQFNCVAWSVLPDWDGTSWQHKPTSNPASIYRDILQGTANKRPKNDDRLDLATIEDFHERCADQGFEFNAVIDFRTTVKQLRQDVLAVGRGAFGLRDMQYSVIQDLQQDSPVDVITPRTSFGFTWTKRFLDLPHAMKVRFVDESNDWQQGERFVYADGYNESNATLIEEVDAGLGVTNGNQVWRLKRREFAEALLRADDYTVQMDFAHLTFTRGDRLQLQHDVILAGLLTARIKTVTVNGGGDAISITFDDLLTMVTGTNYAARIKRANGIQRVEALVTVPGQSNSVTLNTPIPAIDIPAAGDVVIFGELGRESLDVIVKGIEMGQDYQATVHLLDYAPGIQTADSGTIPEYDSHLTLPALDRQLIALPILDQVQSNEDVLLRDVDGSYQSRILITLHFASGYRVPVTKIEAQYRPTGSTDSDWLQLFAPVSGTATTVSIAPVEDGRAYDIQVRTINDDTGASSEWVTIEAHTVIGKTTPPPDVTGLSFDTDGIRWAYPDVPVDFQGFLVRIRPGTSPVWDDAVQLNPVAVVATAYPIIADGSTRVIMVKGVDVAGNESANVAWILQDAAALILVNLAETIDVKALGFPGTKTNCTVVGGNLTADSQTLFWSNDSALFWATDAATFWQGSYKDLTYVLTVTPPANWLTGIMRLQLGITAQGWMVEYRPGSSALFYGNDSTSFWSNDSALFWPGASVDFVGWPGALALPKRQDYEFRISAVGGTIQAVISALNVLFDMPDLREAFTDMAIPIGGARIPLTKPFHFIKSVAVTPKYDGGTMTKLQVFDHQLSPGPLLIGYDDAGVSATGLAGGNVDGY